MCSRALKLAIAGWYRLGVEMVRNGTVSCVVQLTCGGTSLHGVGQATERSALVHTRCIDTRRNAIVGTLCLCSWLAGVCAVCMHHLPTYTYPAVRGGGGGGGVSCRLFFNHANSSMHSLCLHERYVRMHMCCNSVCSVLTVACRSDDL